RGRLDRDARRRVVRVPWWRVDGHALVDRDSRDLHRRALDREHPGRSVCRAPRRVDQARRQLRLADDQRLAIRTSGAPRDGGDQGIEGGSRRENVDLDLGVVEPADLVPRWRAVGERAPRLDEARRQRRLVVADRFLPRADLAGEVADERDRGATALADGVGPAPEGVVGLAVETVLGQLRAVAGEDGTRPAGSSCGGGARRHRHQDREEVDRHRDRGPASPRPPGRGHAATIRPDPTYRRQVFRSRLMNMPRARALVVSRAATRSPSAMRSWSTNSGSATPAPARFMPSRRPSRPGGIGPNVWGTKSDAINSSIARSSWCTKMRSM